MHRRHVACAANSVSDSAPRRLRVAIVAASLRIVGGHSVQAQQLLDGWRHDASVEAWLVPIDPRPRKPFDRLLAIKLIRTIVTQLCYWPLLVREVRRADVVHVFSAAYSSFLLAPLPAVIIARLLRKPVILNYHSGEAPDHLRRSALARFVLKRCVNLVVVPSPFLHEVFATFGIRAEVVPNTIDVARFAYRARDPLRPRLISTRNFEPLYNVACTLRAFARIQARYPEASLTLVGAGSQETTLRTLASPLRNVTFAGRVEPAKMPGYYADADIYIQTPSIDNMPLSLLEAFASGLPSVATRTGGVPAMLHDGVHGLLVPNDDDVAAARQVIRLIEAPVHARYLAAAARETCAAYEWPLVSSGWREAYRSVRTPPAERRARTTFSRLRRMTRDELVWRARAWARIQMQRIVTRIRRPRWNRRALGHILAPGVVDAAMRRDIRARHWQDVHEALVRRIGRRPSRFVLDSSSAEALAVTIRARWPDAAADAAMRADRLLAGRYDVLGYSDLAFPRGAHDIDWHLDPVHGRRGPVAFWADVPYLDPACGDHKVIWELNRHQHWQQLVRASWLTGDPRYRLAIVDRLDSWLAANPPLIGINWASMLELGFRSISWIWAMHGLLAAPDTDPRPWLVDMLIALDRQLTHVEQNLSRFFSPNTHLTGEALALYVAGVALPELAASARWAALGRDILLQEIDRQIHADGGHAEGSTHYHRYTLDIYLLALLTAMRAGDAAAIARFRDAVTRLAEFTRAVADDAGVLPLIGDDDGGLLWPMAGRACRDVRDSLALAAALLGRGDLAPWPAPEEVFWVGGRAAIDRVEWMEAEPDVATAPPSRMFRDTGYFVARDADGGHAVFDIGRHGYLNGGHAHADALAITLNIGGRPLLVDPGTASYVDQPRRDQMRATSSHNTVAIDGRPQSIPDGPFRWRTRTDARLHAWRHNPAFDWAEASHDGYAPIEHRRALLRTSSGWFVVDEISGHGPHTIDTFWHFDPRWAVTVDAPGRLRAMDADGHIAWLVHDAGTATRDRGNERLGLGWYSPVYGTRMPAWVADVREDGPAPLGAVTWIGADPDGQPPTIERLSPRTDSASRVVGARVIAGDSTSILLVRFDEPAACGARDAQLPDYQTNARVLHYASRGGALVALDVIDGTHAFANRDGWLSVTADDPIVELHIGIEDGTMDLRACAPPSRLRFEGDAMTSLRTLRLNGREWPMTHSSASGAPLVVDASQWAEAGAPLATTLLNRR